MFCRSFIGEVWHWEWMGMGGGVAFLADIWHFTIYTVFELYGDYSIINKNFKCIYFFANKNCFLPVGIFDSVSTFCAIFTYIVELKQLGEDELNYLTMPYPLSLVDYLQSHLFDLIFVYKVVKLGCWWSKRFEDFFSIFSPFFPILFILFSSINFKGG